MTFKFPNTTPECAPDALARLQDLLIGEAERRLGRRASAFPIAAPSFHEAGPHATVKANCAIAELSDNARRWWPTAVYELAHECVHLLDDPLGFAPMIEEGCAVLFSIDAQCLVYGQPYEMPSGHYMRALELVAHLPGGYAVPRTIRLALGSLARATPQALLAMTPGLDVQVATELCGYRSMRKAASRP